MNPDEMTPEQVNVAIAEACGWTEIKARTMPMPRSFQGVISQLIGVNPKGVRDTVPNYHGSLDAMAQAEATINTPEEWQAYLGENLPEICANEDTPTECANAAQRARAFLRVKGGTA